MLVSFVIPAYNSEKTLKKLCFGIVEIAEKNKFSYEIIIVNDFSRDRTEDVISVLCDKNSNIKGISLSKNFGQQNALYCGIEYSKGDYIFTVDDDLQNPPELIPAMLERIEKGMDIVYGIPVKNNKKDLRSIGTFFRESFFRRTFKNLNGLKVSSFRVFTKKMKKAIENQDYEFIYISCLLLKNAEKIDNIMYKYTEREIGKSNYSVNTLLKILINLNIYYSNIKFLKIFIKKGNPFDIEKKFNF